MRINLLLSMLFFSIITLIAQNNIDQYNVVWDTPSINSGESMPCGGGDVGLNVWVEKGDLMFYISRAGVFDENNLFPKLGRVRVKLTPNPFTETSVFRQELKLREGFVQIIGDDTKIDVWVDVFRPVIHVQSQSKKPVVAQIEYETWRFKDLMWTSDKQINASRGYLEAPDSIHAIVRADSVNFQGNKIVWSHRNRDRSIFDITVEDQGLSEYKKDIWNPLKGLTFGGAIEGKGMKVFSTGEGCYADIPFRSWSLISEKPSKKHEISIYLHTDNVEKVSDWQFGLDNTIENAKREEKTAKSKSREWWDSYWNRSYVIINNSDIQSKAWEIGRNYQLFRYQLGCNAFGKYPTKFNGGLFTFDPVFVDSSYSGITPDHRNWGGGTHTAQNQRLIYWPMFKSGDFEIIKPQLDYYLNMLPVAELRSHVYWGHEGACFAEQIEQFGLPVAFEYGWAYKRPKSFPAGVDYNSWLEYSWDTVLEFCLMAIEINRYSEGDVLLYMPLIESSLEFFFQHYEYESQKRSATLHDSEGKLIIYPGTGLETYKGAYNPASTLAGLHTVIKRMLELPEKYLTDAKRDYWKKRLAQIPSIPIRIRNGLNTIAPAQVYARINNIEIPQLYPVFPYGMYGIGRPNLDIAINTWKHGLDIPEQLNHVSWHQNAIFCARMGLVDEAKDITIKKMGNSKRRFPTFWGPGHDWVPDHNWGGSGMIGIQEMVMQTVDSAIYLLPSFPADWNVSFKLHAPYKTTIECKYKEGKITYLNVRPKCREKDVTIIPQKQYFQVK